jgi:FKBP-type peptidyl-prolyl cis-trans isomerase FkpA
MTRRAALAALLAAVATAGCGDGDRDEPKPMKTPSGLTYYDVRVGTGRTAMQGDVVEVHYVGRLLANDKKFDSSRDRGVPFAFKLGAGNVIKGWDEGIEGMKVGGKRRLVIPAKLGYGEEGSPPAIPPNADLVFEVELLRIK